MGLISPFMLWRIVLVSLLFTAGAFGIFWYAMARGLDVATARTMVVNMLIVAEIFYLFNVRYLHVRSMTLRGALGTPAVLAAIAIVVVAQLLFTYAPFMHDLFDSRPLLLREGALLIGLGAALFAFLEFEKMLMRRWEAFDELA